MMADGPDCIAPNGNGRIDLANVANEQLRSTLKEWEELQSEFVGLKQTHKTYCDKVKDVKDVQKQCMSGIAHQRYRMKRILDNAKQIANKGSEEDRNVLEDLEKTMQNRKNEFREYEDVLPHQNGLYLSIILGQVNVSLLSKEDKFKYKQEYERFKLVITSITFVVSSLLLLLLQYSFYHSRWIDAGFHFFLVWYYCTLTIREHILKVNGSRIKGWWVTHHFISTVSAGVLLIWPNSASYDSFRKQFMVFTMYLSIVQLVQYYYQSGCMYRLRALGARHTMDITVEGFQSWMWKGLVFVLPFLFVGYFFQLFNAWTLYQIYLNPLTHEWQVPTLSFLFFVLFAGNTWTTMVVVRQKVGHKFNRYFYSHKYKFDNSTKNL